MASPTSAPPTTAPTTAPTESSTQTEATTPTISVGLSTTCQLLFNGKKIAGQAIDLVQSPLTKDEQYHHARVLAADIRGISSRSKANLRPYLDAMAEALANIGAQDGSTVQLGDFQAAGLELIHRCTPYIQ